MKTILSTFLLMFFSCTLIAQLKVHQNGEVTVRYGNFNPNNPGILYLGDGNHYIKSVFGYGIKIGTLNNNGDAIRIPQYTDRVGIYKEPVSPYALDVNGYIRGTNVTLSDIRLKTNIKPLSDKVKLLNKLNGISYEYSFTKENKNNMEGTTHFGFAAQELQKVYPELVITDGEGYLAIDYTSIIALLVEGYKKQASEMEILKSKLFMLSNINKSAHIQSDAYLEQNEPNPFNSETKIKYYIPLESNTASIYIYDLQGVQKKVIHITDREKGQVQLKGGELHAGMYFYCLTVDNMLIDTKRMILTK